MLTENIYLTVTGYEKLKENLKQLKTFERPKVIKDIEEARAHGDLSENAEYHAAKEKQGFLEANIRKLEDVLGRAQVIDPSKLSGERVVFGATITLFDLDREQEETYQLVGEEESDIDKCKLSIKSPIGRALIGKHEGDEVQIKVPGGLRNYEIITVKFQ